MYLPTLFDSLLLDTSVEFVFPLILVVGGLIYFLGRNSNSFWLD